MHHCPQCDNPVSEGQRFCAQCGASLGAFPEFDSSRAIGRVLDGRYRIRYHIGMGGMGAVYRAEVVDMGHSVAVKILHPTLAADRIARSRLENEARLASQIDHPNIVSIIDFHADPGLTYLVMEYLSGESLAEVLAAVGYVGVRRAVNITLQLLSALEASHRLNVLHRDLKPENIFLIARNDQIDYVKVLDFGMALSSAESSRNRITAHGHVCGTPAYMSPEQAKGKDLTQRSDLYAVGVILYECLTGVNPFLGSTAAETLVNQITRTPDPPSRVCQSAKIPPYLDALVMRALTKAPGERFESAGEFRRILEAAMLAERKRTAAAVPGGGACPHCGRAVSRRARRCDGCGLSLWPSQGALRSLKRALPADVARTFPPSVPDVPPLEVVRGEGPAGIPWDPPLVGMADEMARIEQLFDDASLRDRGHVLRVLGPGGAGKGRLAREAARMAGRLGWQVVTISPHELPTLTSLWPARRAVAALLGLPAASLRDPDQAVDEAMAAGFDGACAAGLAELLGSPRADRAAADARLARRADAWREAVRTAAQRRPVLLVALDIDRLDAPSRDLVAALVDTPPAANPVNVIATQDPRLMLLWPETETIVLPPLGARDARLLAGRLLDRVRIDEDPARVAAASGGSPLMLIELVRLLALDRRIHFPRGLAEVVNQRVGMLPGAARTLLHAAAVFGRPAEADLLASLAGVSRGALASEAVGRLADAGFVVHDDGGWRLPHQVHREVAYLSVPAGMRARLHAEAAARAMDDGAPAACVAFHLFEAADYEAAVPHLLRAGREARRALDAAQAARHFRDVLQVVPSPPRTLGGSRHPWLTAQLGLASALEAEDDIDAALQLLRHAAQAAGEARWEPEQSRLLDEYRRIHAGAPGLEAAGDPRASSRSA